MRPLMPLVGRAWLWFVRGSCGNGFIERKGSRRGFPSGALRAW